MVLIMGSLLHWHWKVGLENHLVEIGVAPMVPTSTGTLYSALINTIKKLKTFALQDMYKNEDFPKVFKATEEARASH